MTCRRLLGVFLFLVTVTVASVRAEPPQVEANGERLLGDRAGEVAAFRGIPFAAAPVGELRWRAPQPHAPRDGLQTAREFAPACMQDDGRKRWRQKIARGFGADPAAVGESNGVSEDCLYLNVWTPRPEAAAGLPVLVWVHGGSNSGGWSYESSFIGDRLAGRGLVVVTIAYRLGPFGFFTHPKLDNGRGAPVANFGWLDMAQALRWVRTQINVFGGDPGNITLAGASSGAGNLLDFAVQDVAVDLGFSRLILQSAPNPFERRQNILEAMAAGEALIGYLGLDNANVTGKRLRSIPAADLLRAAEAVQPLWRPEIVKDAATFVRTPGQALQDPVIGHWDLLIGSNADEWAVSLDESTIEADVDHWLYQHAPRAAPILKSLVYADGNARRALDRLYTARGMACPARYLAERVTAAGGRARVYEFNRRHPGRAAALGAYDGAEIAYVFDQHESWQSTDEKDLELTETVMDYWVSFARDGNPNLPARSDWPLYRAEWPQVLELGDQVAAVTPRDHDLCLWLGPGGGSTFR